MSPQKPIPAELPVGEIFAGRYEVLELLGVGATASVYKVRDRLAREVIALKLIKPSAAENPKLASNFKREISVARRISHPNVLRIFDIAEYRGQFYILMELVEGNTLLDMLTERGRFRVADFLPVFRQLLDALAAAHREGILHRDIKPANLMFDRNGVLKLMDFGIARFVGGEQSFSPAMGTPAYLSPEQLMGMPLTQSADIFSSAAMAFELLTGRLPYMKASVAERCTMPPPRIRDLAPHVPADLAEVIERCLEPVRENRYQSIDDVIAAAKNIHPPQENEPEPGPAPQAFQTPLSELISAVPPPIREILPVFIRVLKRVQRIYADGAAPVALTPATILMETGGGIEIDTSQNLNAQATVAIRDPKYFPPDVFAETAGEPTVPKHVSDVYSLGFIFYEIVLGRRLFEREFAYVLSGSAEFLWLRWHGDLEQRARPAIEVRTDTPRALSDVVARMMEKDPSKRAQSVDEVLPAFQGVLRSLQDTQELEPVSTPGVVVTKIPTAEHPAKTPTPIPQVKEPTPVPPPPPVVERTPPPLPPPPPIVERTPTPVPPPPPKEPTPIPPPPPPEPEVLRTPTPLPVEPEPPAKSATPIPVPVKEPTPIPQVPVSLKDPTPVPEPVPEEPAPPPIEAPAPVESESKTPIPVPPAEHEPVAPVTKDRTPTPLPTPAKSKTPLPFVPEKPLPPPKKPAVEPSRGHQPQMLQNWKAGAVAAAIVVVAGALYYSSRPSTKTPDANKAPGRTPSGKQAPIRYPSRIDTQAGPMVLIPGGEYLMGRVSDPVLQEKVDPIEGPVRNLRLESYYIDVYEVTNAQYKAFCEAAQRPLPKPPKWDAKYLDKGNFPVINVSWEDARAYAAWAKKRLPIEAEWEISARGVDARLYPWGSSYTPGTANITGEAKQRPVAVGAFPFDFSPFGVMDLGGNVPEWVDSDYKPYPASQAKLPAEMAGFKVVRGGSFDQGEQQATATHRTGASPALDPAKFSNIGFRCVTDPANGLKIRVQQPGN